MLIDIKIHHFTMSSKLSQQKLEKISKG